MMSDETILKIGDIEIPVGAGRGISQTIEPIENGDLRRTVNGELVDLTRAANRKFSSSISCVDMSYPALVGVWRGQILDVECIEKFHQNIYPAALTVELIRPYVSGTVFGRNAAGAKVTPDSIVGDLVTFLENCVMVEYRPTLTMMVTEFSIDRDEYGAETSWNLGLEEV